MGARSPCRLNRLPQPVHPHLRVCPDSSRQPSGPLSGGLLCCPGGLLPATLTRVLSHPWGGSSFLSLGGHWGARREGLLFPVDFQFSVPGKHRLGHFVGSDLGHGASRRPACWPPASGSVPHWESVLGAGGCGEVFWGCWEGASVLIDAQSPDSASPSWGAKPCSPRLGLELPKWALDLLA